MAAPAASIVTAAAVTETRKILVYNPFSLDFMFSFPLGSLVRRKHEREARVNRPCSFLSGPYHRLPVPKLTDVKDLWLTCSY
ncbi:MAG: hypothetical protein AUG84_00275 [Chloroflexi bacterium 13_1_20CM_4_66_7]|nr:MAG: hypothetical protein AUG84_00275 [Chloroflexi bacterium 13_1_20CM_4_66_7]